MVKTGFSVTIWFREAYHILHYGFYFILGLKYFPLETMSILLISQWEKNFNVHATALYQPYKNIICLN